MPEFAYTARDRYGRTIEGTIHADNSALAAGKVRELGYTPERVRALQASGRPERPRQTGASVSRRLAENFVYPVVSGVRLKELAVFYRQFSTMINAGIPLYQSLVTLEAQCKRPRLAGILRECQGQVQAGGPLSEVFARYPWVFSELQIEMIRAAEHGGMLDRMLLRIADYLEKEISLRQLISRLTIYPKIVMVVAWFVLGVRFFVDGMPAVSKLVIGMMGKMDYGAANYLLDTVIPFGIIAAVTFGVVAFCRISLFQSDSVRESYERFKMSVPGLGPVVRKFALAKFGRAFAAMYEAGLPLNAAVRVGGNASGSRIIARATSKAISATERGAVLSQSFRETGVFPPIVLDMLHTGEQTGNVDAMMEKMAEYLEGEAETKAHMNAHIFAAAVGLIVAILVATAIIRFYMTMGSSVQNAINAAGDAAGAAGRAAGEE